MKRVVIFLCACRGDPAPPPAAPPVAIRAPIYVRAPLPPPPRSLVGTEPDGAFTRDAHGRIAFDDGARELFAYYLTAEGEEPDDTIRARIADRARGEGVDPDEALALFALYVATR